MPENMSISVNGHSRVPPGFRFHPTEEELLLYYLKKKVAYQKIDLDVICEVDLNKLEPWDIQEKCRIGTTPQNDWYFFSHKDKKYPTGTRTNRATAAGFWKATGRDKMIYSSGRRIGMRKTLVFYKGRAPHGNKSDWIMHEYRLDEGPATNVASSIDGETTQEEGWVVCRIFKKKNHPRYHHHKFPSSPVNSSSAAVDPGAIQRYQCISDEGALEQIFKQPERSMKLPGLESPNNSHSQILVPLENEIIEGEPEPEPEPGQAYQAVTGLSDWAAFDRLVASHLNGQNAGETSKLLACFSNQNVSFCAPSDEDLHSLSKGPSIDCSEIDLWSFTRSASSSSLIIDDLPAYK